MTQHSKEVEKYISKSADFAKPLLEYLRKIIFETCADVEESIKWGTPHYSYKGDHLCMMGAFKKHCSFSLYKAEFMKDKLIIEGVKAGKKYGYMDKLTSTADLPPKKVLVAYLKEAIKINEQGMKFQRQKSNKPKLLATPDYFTNALKGNAKASRVFNEKSDAFRKNYLVWIVAAKTEATRQERIEQSLDWIAAGKVGFGNTRDD